ncbi:MAG: thioredoxin-disulfide reductase [Candidatus Omnitrophota bacterium]|nr:MAG: thioredoxin-disulfide reductase [Candidatus Omnitrophota bacterium]
MSGRIYDVIIIGGGPAGLSAGIYASRERISTLLLEKGMCGGLLTVADLIENYPGFPNGIKGMDLVNKFKEQAKRFGTEIVELKEVKEIKPVDGNIMVKTDKEEYSSHALIAASGTIPRKLGIPGEKQYTGKGVSYCATCDGPLFKNKDIVVVGGGNAAVEEALFLTKFAGKIIFVHRRYELRAAKILQENLRRDKKIELLLNHKLISIAGDKTVNSVNVFDNHTKKQTKFEVSGVFIYAGFLPNSKFLEGIVEFDDSGYIKVDGKMQTQTPGIFAAGDICSKNVRQVTTACAEGTIAAMSVRDYLKKER